VHVICFMHCGFLTFRRSGWKKTERGVFCPNEALGLPKNGERSLKHCTSNTNWAPARKNPRAGIKVCHYRIADWDWHTLRCKRRLQRKIESAKSRYDQELEFVRKLWRHLTGWNCSV
jgi:hypothetical protein